MPLHQDDLDIDTHTSSFSLAENINTHILLQGKQFNILYGYTCRWTLKLHQFPYFIT